MNRNIAVPTARFEAVTFDCWNTLLIDRPSDNALRRVAACLGILDEIGIEVERPTVETAINRAAQAFVSSWTANRMFTAADAAEVCLTHLNLTVFDKLRDPLTEILSEVDPDVQLAPGAADTLRALRRAGLRLGIVCDVGLSPSDRLIACLERRGILELFDHLSFSDQVGVFKPAPEIFDDVLRGLGLDDPAAVAHVGDLRHTDVMGARRSGLTSIRYTGVFDDASDLPDADFVIGHHRELAAIVLSGVPLEERPVVDR